MMFQFLPQRYSSCMGSYTHRLSLGADHETADLAALPEALDLPAKHLWRAGDVRVAPPGRVQGGNHKRSYCSIEFEPGADLPESLAVAVARLKPHKEFLARLSADGVKFRFFVGWFSESNSGERHEWALLRDIADLRISLDFDVYGPDAQ
jgi:hypothetical protein